jgi:hypothetical protein
MRIPRIVSEGLDAVLSSAGFTSEMKLELFTLGRNNIMMRVENIGDIFNTNGQVTYQTVDIDYLATSLFDLVNGYPISSEFVTIEETSLTGNQPYELMVKNKIKWVTADDVAPKTTHQSEGVTLQQQRIRVFKVTYNVSETAFLQ